MRSQRCWFYIGFSNRIKLTPFSGQTRKSNRKWMPKLVPTRSKPRISPPDGDQRPENGNRHPENETRSQKMEARRRKTDTGSQKMERGSPKLEPGSWYPEPEPPWRSGDRSPSAILPGYPVGPVGPIYPLRARRRPRRVKGQWLVFLHSPL